MKKLNKMELLDVNGGLVANASSNGNTRLEVQVTFTGEAAKHIDTYKGMYIVIRDSQGPAKADLNAANGWKAVFYVKAGDPFEFDFDLRRYYPYIKNFTYSFNKTTNVVTYVLS